MVNHQLNENLASRENWGPIREAVLDELSRDSGFADKDLCSAVDAYFFTETALEQQAVVETLRAISDEISGFGKQGLQEFLTHSPHITFEQLSTIAQVLDELYDQKITDLEGSSDATVNVTLSTLFPNLDIHAFHSAVQETVSGIDDFSGSLGVPQVASIINTYETLIKSDVQEDSVHALEVLEDDGNFSNTIHTVLEKHFTTEQGTDRQARQERIDLLVAECLKAISPDITKDNAVKTQLAQGISAWYMMQIGSGGLQEVITSGSTPTTDGSVSYSKKAITDLFVSPFAEDNDLVNDPDELIATIKTLVDESSDPTAITWQMVVSRLSNTNTATTVAHDLDDILTTRKTAKEPGMFDGFMDSMKTISSKIGTVMKGIGGYLREIYKQIGPQLREAFEMLQGFFGELGFGSDRDFMSFETKIESLIVMTNGTLEPYESAIVSAMSQRFHAIAGSEVSLERDGLDVIGASIWNVFGNNEDNDFENIDNDFGAESKHLNKYKKVIAKHQTRLNKDKAQASGAKEYNRVSASDVTMSGQIYTNLCHLCGVGDGKVLEKEAVQNFVSAMHQKWAGKFDGSIVISSPEKFFEMLSAYILTGNEDTALKLGWTYQEKVTQAKEGSPVAISNISFKDDTCFVDYPSVQEGYAVYRQPDGSTQAYPYDPNKGIPRGETALNETITFFVGQASGSSITPVPGTENKKFIERDTDRQNVQYKYREGKNTPGYVPGNKSIQTIERLLLTAPRNPPKSYVYVLTDAVMHPGPDTPGTSYDARHALTLTASQQLRMKDDNDTDWHKIPGSLDKSSVVE